MTAPASTSPPTGLARPLWLVATVAAIALITAALGYRTIALDRKVHARYKEATTLAPIALDAQQAGAALQGAQLRQGRDAAVRGGPDLSGSDAVELELLADALARSLQQFEALPLTSIERVQLTNIIETARSLPTTAAKPSASSSSTQPFLATTEQAPAALEQDLARFLAATGERMVALAREAEAEHHSARVDVMAFSVVFLLLVCALLVMTFRIQYSNRQMLKRLSQMTQEDPLTGIMNRRGLDGSLEVELARAKRSRQPLTLVMMDLDFFKRYNDRRGHAAGDALLRGAAQAWARQLRPTDLIARYGGEEFTLVLASCGADQAALMVDRLRPLVPDRQTFSAGIATWDEGEGGTELLQRADLALAQAKKTGRNRSMIAGREPQVTLPLQMA